MPEVHGRPFQTILAGDSLSFVGWGAGLLRRRTRTPPANAVSATTTAHTARTTALTRQLAGERASGRALSRLKKETVKRRMWNRQRADLLRRRRVCPGSCAGPSPGSRANGTARSAAQRAQDCTAKATGGAPQKHFVRRKLRNSPRRRARATRNAATRGLAQRCAVTRPTQRTQKRHEALSFGGETVRAPHPQ